MKEKIRVFKNINEGTTGLRSEFFLPKSTASMYHCQRHNGPISGWVLLLKIILNRSFTGVKIFYQVPYSPLAGGNITFWGHVYSALLASSGTFSRLFCLGSDCLRFKGLISGMELNLSIHICRFICINEITVYFKWIAKGQFTFCTCCQIFGDIPATQFANVVIRALIQMPKSD